MPKASGMDVLKEIKKSNPYIEVIIITGYPTIDSAVTAIKVGAFDFICKPFDVKEITSTVRRCLDKQKVIETIKQCRYAISPVDKILELLKL